MSQRDDELIQLLRAELTRRDAMTPREGFDMRVHATVRGLERPSQRGLQRLLGAGAAVAAVAAVAVALALGLRAHQNGGVTSPARRPAPTPAGQPVLVLQDAAAVGDVVTTLVRGDGHVVHTVHAPASADRSELVGAGLLLVGARDDWVLHRDGTVTPVSAAAKSELDRVTPIVVMIDDHTALGMEGQGYEQLVEVDVLSGATTVLLDAQIPPDVQMPSGDAQFDVLGVSRDRHTAYVLVRDMLLGGRRQVAAAVIDVDLFARRAVRTRTVPDTVVGDVLAISPDGRLVAWRDNHVDVHRNIQYLIPHVTDLATGHTVDIPSATMAATMSFSPDGARLLIEGNDNEATPEGIEAIALVSSQDGRVLRRAQSASMFNDSLTPVGWLDNDHVAYYTVHSDRPGSFNTSDAVIHVIDTAGRDRPVTIAGRGAAVSILD